MRPAAAVTVALSVCDGRDRKLGKTAEQIEIIIIIIICGFLDAY